MAIISGNKVADTPFAHSIFNDPVALDDVFAVARDGTLTVSAIAGLLSNDFDPDGGDVDVVLITNTTDNGNLSVFGNGNFTYTPDAGFTGTDSFTYRIRDEDGNFSHATVTIEVFDNTGPTLGSDTYTMMEGAPLSITAPGVLQNDFDPDGGDVRVSLITNTVDNGGLTAFQPGNFTYTPDAGFIGTDGFTYRARDDEGDTSTADVSIIVVENPGPVAGDDIYTLKMDETLSVAASGGLLLNDFDPDGGDINVVLITNTTDNGSVTVFGGGNFTYTPDDGFVGTDSFTYRVRDEEGKTTEATVTLVVADDTDPIAGDDEFSLFEGDVLSISAPGLLANDLDPDGGDVSIILITDTTDNGSISVFGGGNFTYTPDAGFTGTDSFTYRIRDDEGSITEASVTLNVLSHESPFAGDDSYTMFNSGTLSVTAENGLLTNDLDPDGGDVSVILITDTTDNGSVSVFGNGSFNYTPDSGFFGTDSFTYRIRDNEGETTTATATINVLLPHFFIPGLNTDVAPTAINDVFSVREGEVLTISAPGVLGNDQDRDGGSVEVILITDTVDNGSVTVFGNGNFNYTPDAGFSGTDSFTYRIRDNEGKTAEATATIHVIDIPEPIATDDHYSMTQNGTLSVSADVGLLRNDIDQNGDDLSVILITSTVDNGTVTVFGGGNFNYTPDSGFVGTDSFTYRIRDTDGQTSEATVTIDVAASPAPVVGDDVFTMRQGQTLSVNAVDGLLKNAFDPDGGDVNVVLISDTVDNGSVTVFGGGNFTYTPDAGFFGTDRFSYRVRDDEGVTTEATATIFVAENLAPIAAADEYSLIEGDVLTVTAADGVLRNDLDPESDAFQVILVTDTTDNGSVTLFANGRFTYTPDAGFFGTDSFSYRIRDDLGATSEGTVTLNVAEHRPPMALDDFYATNAGVELTVNADAGLLRNDVDPWGEDISVVLITDTTDHGSLTVFGNGNFTYTPDFGFAGVDSFTYRIRNASGKSDEGTVTIGVIGEVDPNAADDLAFLLENESLAIDVLSNDFDFNDQDVSIVSFSDGQFGSVNQSDDGKLIYTPNEGQSGEDSFTYTISDGHGGLDTATVTVHVTPQNDAPVMTSFGPYSVAENQAGVSTVIATDADGDTLTYSIIGGADAALFSVDGATGALSFDTAPDFEDPLDANFDNTYEVQVSVNDGELSDDELVRVRVRDVNEAPILSAFGLLLVDEGIRSAGIVQSFDADGDTLAYSIIGGPDAALFSIDKATGELSFNSAPDFEAPADANGDTIYDVKVEVSDGVLTDTGTVFVSVLNVNEAPLLQPTGPLAVDENTTDVTVLTALDLEGDEVGFSIEGGADGGLFEIDKVTGALSFISAPDFEASGDADGDNVYEVEVSASDGALSTKETLFVTVENVNEAPSLLPSGPILVDENTTEVATIGAVDPEGDSLSMTIIGGADAALFAIDKLTGELTFNTAPDFEAPSDANGDNTYEVQIAARDSEFSDDAFYFISVQDVDETPEPTLIEGTSGNDRNLMGTEGDDVINSGAGRSDIMSGLGGADIFDFSGIAGNGIREVRRIKDFDALEGDMLDLGDASVVRVREVRDSTYLYLDGDRDLIVLEGVIDFEPTSIL